MADTSQPVWARDLVCFVTNTGVVLSEDEMLLLGEEFENGVTTPSLTLSVGMDTLYTKVKLFKLTYHQWVNAFAKKIYFYKLIINSKR